ncbi:gag-pol polyprotein [Cucumis melo var. makuwa]|uniref:Gag-pol polyprotein n=1 Tax=Cucumis melo var. makuwa TaxID=1194695 RepID=A0A5A7V4Q0_CUCMM|nr:gag-pol polyprotein [Cucumis melo var. makuwa]
MQPALKGMPILLQPLNFFIFLQGGNLLFSDIFSQILNAKLVSFSNSLNLSFSFSLFNFDPSHSLEVGIGTEFLSSRVAPFLEYKSDQAFQALKGVDLKGIYRTWPLFLSRSEQGSIERSSNSPSVESIRKKSRMRRLKRDRGIQKADKASDQIELRSVKECKPISMDFEGESKVQMNKDDQKERAVHSSPDVGIIGRTRVACKTMEIIREGPSASRPPVLDAKEAWRILVVSYEGTSKVKISRLQLITSKFEALKMSEVSGFMS